jgi:hypothetical protein
MIALPGEPPTGFDYQTVIREMMLARGGRRRDELLVLIRDRMTSVAEGHPCIAAVRAGVREGWIDTLVAEYFIGFFACCVAGTLAESDPVTIALQDQLDHAGDEYWPPHLSEDELDDIVLTHEQRAQLDARTDDLDERIFQRSLELETEAMNAWGEAALAHGLNTDPDTFLERSERGRTMFLGEWVES